VNVIIRLKFNSALTDYTAIPEDFIEYAPGKSIRAFLYKYSLTAGLIGLVVVNGKIESLEYIPPDNSTIKLYPIFGGG
jgi:hypothetical protein